MEIGKINSWTLTQAVCPGNLAGSVSGIQNFGGNLGGILAPWLTGYVVQTTKSFVLALGIPGVFPVGGILADACLVRSTGPIERNST
jgi:MFS family permease